MKKIRPYFLCFCFISELIFSLGLCQENGIKKLTQQSEYIAPAEIGINEYKPIIDPVSNRKESSRNFKEINSISIRTKKNVKTTLSNKNNELDSIMDDLQEDLSQNVDNNEYSKIQSFNVVETDFERFKNSPCYDKIGFNPSWEMDSLEKEYQACETEHSSQMLKNMFYILLFIVIIGVIIMFSLPKKKKN